MKIVHSDLCKRLIRFLINNSPIAENRREYAHREKKCTYACRCIDSINYGIYSVGEELCIFVPKPDSIEVLKTKKMELSLVIIIRSL